MRKILDLKSNKITEKDFTKKEKKDIESWQKPLEYRLLSYLKAVRDNRALVYTYKDVEMRLTDGARADLTATYVAVATNALIPDETIMLNWKEKDFAAISITAGDLRSDALEIMAHRQKCFTAYVIASESIKNNIVSSEAEVLRIFDQEYANA